MHIHHVLLVIFNWQVADTWQHGKDEPDISCVDLQENVKGTALGDQISRAFYAASDEIHFLRKMGLDRFQTYSRHLSIISIGVNAPQYLIARSYVSFPFPNPDWMVC